jgi:hypothetical protein
VEEPSSQTWSNPVKPLRALTVRNTNPERLVCGLDCRRDVFHVAASVGLGVFRGLMALNVVSNNLALGRLDKGLRLIEPQRLRSASVPVKDKRPSQ